MNCKICGADTKLLFCKEFKHSNRVDMVPVPELPLSREWPFHECTWCHALQTSAMDNLSLEELATFYTYEKSYIPRAQNRANRAMRFVDRAMMMFPKTGNRLLSYGAGISPEPDMFANCGWKVDTCDFGTKYTFTPDQLPQIDTRYNVISSMEVLEHLINPKEVLTQILQHLVPGGVFVASTGLWSRLRPEQRVPEWWYVHHCTEGHIFIWTLQALDIIAQENDCFVTVLGNTSQLCMGMRGAGQAPIIIRKYDKQDL